MKTESGAPPGFGVLPDRSPDAALTTSLRQNLFKYAQRGARCREAADADDAVQDALLAGWRAGGHDPSKDPVALRFYCLVLGRHVHKERAAVAFHADCLTKDGELPEVGTDAASGAGCGLTDVEEEALERVDDHIGDDEEVRRLLAAKRDGAEHADELAQELGLPRAEDVYPVAKRLKRHVDAVRDQLRKR